MNNDISALLEQIVFNAKDIFPKILSSLAIVVFGYLFGLMIRRLSRKAIIYLDQVINDRVSQKALEVDLKSSSIFISRTFFWIILIASFLIALKVLKLEMSDAWLEGIILYLPNIIASVVIVFTGIIVGRLIGDLVGSSSAFAGLNDTHYLGKAARYTVLFIAIVIAIDQLGVHIQFLTTLITIVLAALLFGATLAFGLGAKNSVNNILSAYYVKKNYQIGHRIQIGEVSGVIVKITDHAITLENKSELIVIPAKDFAEHKVIINKA